MEQPKSERGKLLCRSKAKFLATIQAVTDEYTANKNDVGSEVVSKIAYYPQSSRIRVEFRAFHGSDIPVVKLFSASTSNAALTKEVTITDSHFTSDSLYRKIFFILMRNKQFCRECSALHLQGCAARTALSCTEQDRQEIYV